MKVWLACWLAISWSLFFPPGVAWAVEGVVVVAAGAEMQQPMNRARVELLLGKAGYRSISWVSAADLERRVCMIPVVDMRASSACGGAVQVESWRQRLEGAHELLQMLDIDGALAELVDLELEVACLDGVPPQQDLFLLELVVADAHRLAAASERELGLRFFHQGESEHALRTAATFAADLPPPAWLDPELGDLLAAIQSSYAFEDAVSAVIWGEGRGLWLDGVQVGTGARSLSPGRHLIQSAPDGRVIAGGVVDVEPGSLLLIQVTPRTPPLMAADLDLALHELAMGEGDEPILNHLLSLLGRGGHEALIVALLQDGVHIWGRGSGNLFMRYPGPLEQEIRKRNPATGSSASASIEQGPQRLPVVVPVEVLPWRLGAGPAFFASGLGGGNLEGLGGPAGGLAVSARYSVGSAWAVAATVHPVARVEPLPVGYDDNWLVRVMVPGRVGVRYGPPRDRPGGEVGVDGGLVYMGRFERRQELRAFGALAAGVAVPMASGVCISAEAWLGMGVGWSLGGLQLLVGYP